MLIHATRFTEINITSTGTVPAKYKSVIIVPPTGTRLEAVEPFYSYKLVNATTGVTLITISLTWDPDDFLQIDAEEKATVNFVAHFEQDVAENWHGTFRITIIYENWSP